MGAGRGRMAVGDLAGEERMIPWPAVQGTLALRRDNVQHQQQVRSGVAVTIPACLFHCDVSAQDQQIPP